MIKLKIFTAFDNFVLNQVGPFYRRIGQWMIRSGNETLGEEASDDRLVQCLRKVSANGQIPNIQNARFTAPNSVLVGNVTLNQNSSIWYGATLRADQKSIEIGNNSIIQDNVYIKNQTTVKNNVYVGPNSHLDGCTIGEDSFIGMGSTVLKGAHVNGVVAAGSIVPENANIKQGEIWAGSPAKYLRDITPQELQILREFKQEINQLAEVHAEECGKDFRQLILDADNIVDYQMSTYEEAVLQKLHDLNFPLEPVDEEFIEQRVFLKETRPKIDTLNLEDNPTPYEQDLSQYPENFRKYQEDVSLFEEAKRYFEQNPSAKADQFPPQQQYHDDEPWNKKY